MKRVLIAASCVAAILVSGLAYLDPSPSSRKEVDPSIEDGLGRYEVSWGGVGPLDADQDEILRYEWLGDKVILTLEERSGGSTIETTHEETVTHPIQATSSPFGSRDLYLVGVKDAGLPSETGVLEKWKVAIVQLPQGPNFFVMRTVVVEDDDLLDVRAFCVPSASSVVYLNHSTGDMLKFNVNSGNSQVLADKATYPLLGPANSIAIREHATSGYCYFVSTLPQLGEPSTWHPLAEDIILIAWDSNLNGNPQLIEAYSANTFDAQFPPPTNHFWPGNYLDATGW